MLCCFELIVCAWGRWNSWNFFACNINETVIKETGIFLPFAGTDNQSPG